MEEYSQKILDALPEDGSKISGGELRKLIDVTRTEFDKGKAWLRDNGLVELGRGRGGTISRVVGAEAPPEPKKLSKAEIAELARQAKEEKKRSSKQRQTIFNSAMEKTKKKFPKADKIEGQVWDLNTGKCFMYPWFNGVAHPYEVYGDQ